MGFLVLNTDKTFHFTGSTARERRSGFLTNEVEKSVTALEVSCCWGEQKNPFEHQFWFRRKFCSIEVKSMAALTVLDS